MQDLLYKLNNALGFVDEVRFKIKKGIFYTTNPYE